MTPSQWEQGRSPEHDALQADVLEWLRAQPRDPVPLRLRGRTVQVERVQTNCEVLLSIRGRIAGFCDIVDWWQEVGPTSKPARIVYVYEIKPRITSAGAIVRQLRATEYLFEKWLVEEVTPAEVRIAPVVPINDPNIGMLRRLWSGPVFMWNAEERTLS
jgi:hypothetical protein